MVECRPAGRGQQRRRALVARYALVGMPAWLAGLVGMLAHYAEHVPDAEHGRGPLPAPASLPAPAEDAACTPPSVERVLAPPRTTRVRTAATWPAVPLAPVLDEADGYSHAPPLQGGAVPAYGVTWHGSGDDQPGGGERRRSLLEAMERAMQTTRAPTAVPMRGGLFLLTLHPHVSGYRSRLPVLERLIAHAKARGGCWFAPHADVVRWCKERAG